MLHEQIDFYKDAWARESSGAATLPDIIEAIRSDEFAEKIRIIRGYIAAGEKAKADEAKKHLPAVSLSGTVAGARAKAVAENRFTHSGFLQIDLDAKDNHGWSVEAMRDALQSRPEIVATFTTPSGAGVKGVAKIIPDAAKHKACFLAAEAAFAELGLKIDPSCKDPVRLCFLSHDPQAWMREEETGAIFIPSPELPRGDVIIPESDPEKPNATSIGRNGGLIIRGNRQPMTSDDVRAMLRCIPRQPYDEWLRICSAVWDALGEDAGTAALIACHGEEQPGEYAKKFPHRLNDVRAASLVYLAQQHGYAPPRPVSNVPVPNYNKSRLAQPENEVKPDAEPDPNEIPADYFPVPNGLIGNNLAARHIFAIIAPGMRLFSRNGAIYEVILSGAEPRLEQMKAMRFASEIEDFGGRVMIREAREDGSFRWRGKTMSPTNCEILLNSTAAREYLPHIQQITGSPVLAWSDAGAELLGHGWHNHGGGVYVTGTQEIPVMSLDDAKVILFGELLRDINFADAGDMARGAASFISPALKIGRWIDDDFPIDVAEADQSQAGKSYRHKMVAAVYGEIPNSISNSSGGVGSLDERIGGALITGRPIITLENIRGRLDSQTLESAIRGQGRVMARGYRCCAEVETSPFIWQLSTNGTELTRDLANRAVITRIRKQPDGHAYQKFAGGLDILQQIKKNQPRYLGAIHAILRAWADAGRPTTNETRHDFRGWVQALDWIVQNLLGLSPLMDMHREQQERTANPKMQWLRDVLQSIVTSGKDLTYGLTAMDFAEECEDAEIALPGRKSGSYESEEVTIGKILGKLYRDARSEIIRIDGMTLERGRFMERGTHGDKERKIYVLTLQK